MSEKFEGNTEAPSTVSNVSSWISEAVSDAWTVSQPFQAEMRQHGAGRLEVAATTEFVAGASVVAGAVSIGLGAICAPIDAAVKACGADTGRSVKDDIQMMKDGAEALLQAPIVAANGIYSLFAPTPKRHR